MTGGMVVACFVALERFLRRQFSWTVFFLVFIVFGFVAASYQTWHDEYELHNGKAARRAEHVVQLQKFWSEGGVILNDEPTKENFDQWVDKINAWVNNTAAWIDKNMGALARDKFLDTSGMMAMTYSRAISPAHNRAVQNINRLRDNLRYLIDNDSWDHG